MNRKIAFAISAWIAGNSWLYAQEAVPSIIGSDQIVLSTTAPTVTPPTSSVTNTPNGWLPTFSTCSDGCSGRASRLYGSVDYLLFRFRDGPAPPLVQHVMTQDFPAQGQSLNPDDAITIFGDGIRQNSFSGITVMAGYWFNDNWAVDASYTEFETKSKNFYIQTDGDPSIGRFYTDLTNSSQPLTYLIYGNPNGSVSGSINVTAPTRLWGFDINTRRSGTAIFAERFDWIFGFRYWDLREGLFIQDYYQDNVNNVTFTGEDRFYTTNQFYGAQLGGNSYFDLGCGFCLDATFKLAMGGVRQIAQIHGVTVERRNGVIVNQVIGDVLTQPTNVGTFERGYFAVVPELLIKLGYNFNSRFSVNIGYNLIAISNVIRPGSTIDEGVNPNVNPYLVPSTANNVQRPSFNFNGTDFWAQGLTLGFAVRY